MNIFKRFLQPTMRITLGQVRQAYKKTGIKPIACAYASFDDQKRVTCGCPQTALYIARYGQDGKTEIEVGTNVDGWFAVIYGHDYSTRFRIFFDNPDQPDWANMTEREKQARDDGRSIRRALEKEIFRLPPAT